jgi:hypothetical protein
MAVYWLTFRLTNDTEYESRYDNLIEVVRMKSSSALTHSERSG